MAYQRARTKERREHVQLTMDMYILTFGLYGGMAILALLVFLGEVLIGPKQPKVQEITPKNKDNGLAIENTNESNEHISKQKNEEDQGDENKIEVLVHEKMVVEELSWIFYDSKVFLRNNLWILFQ